MTPKPLAAAVLGCFLGLGHPAAAQDLPDLVLDTATLASSLTTELITFVPGAPNSCVLVPPDLCVDGPGARKLLRFSVYAINEGTADVQLGSPVGNPLFVYSACHMHYHFDSFARYELRPRSQPDVVKVGTKRAFCVEDTRAATASTPKKYDCMHQGVQVGWGDLYPSTLDCQWIDITDVAPGDYDLHVFINVAEPPLIPESRYDNDSGFVPVTIAGPTAEHPAPRVKVRAPHGGQKRRLGRALHVTWRARVRGGSKAIRTQEVWLSRDGGATFELLGAALAPRARAFKMVLTGAASDDARVRVVVWSTDLQRGLAESGTFRIVP